MGKDGRNEGRWKKGRGRSNVLLSRNSGYAFGVNPNPIKIARSQDRADLMTARNTNT